MTTFATVALFRRNGKMIFLPPVKIVLDNVTQARKSAARLWNAAIKEPDKLSRVVVIHGDSHRISLSERTQAGKWVETQIPTGAAGEQAHLKACLPVIGVKLDAVMPMLPDVIEVNGIIYRREI